MRTYGRYALYALADDSLHRAASHWMGWDSIQGEMLTHPDVPGLPDAPEVLTQAPRKYGFHGTIKPPFRLATGQDFHALKEAGDALARGLAPVDVGPLKVATLGGFVALIPAKPGDGLPALAAQVVEALDEFRAPLNVGEIAKRRKAGLTERQDEYLERWGYPYVMDEFRYHMTLSGKLEAAQAGGLAERLADYLAPVMPSTFVVDSLGLLGEADDGYFYLIHRYTLSG